MISELSSTTVNTGEIASIDTDQSVEKPKRSAKDTNITETNTKSENGSSTSQTKTVNSLFAENPLSKEQLNEASEVANNTLMKSANEKLRFTEDEKTGKVVIQIVDKTTDKVIKQIPPQDFLNLIYNMNKVASSILKDLPKFI